MKKAIKKGILSFSIVALSTTYFSAQPPLPPAPTTQGTEDGAPDNTPIDMYTLYLAIAGAGIIVYSVGRNRKQTV